MTARSDDPRAGDPRSMAELLGDLARDTGDLFRKEAQLLRSEIGDTVGRLEAGIGGGIVAGAVCLMAALLVLLQAVVIGLAELGLGPGWASLLVGIVVAVVGLVLLRSGAGAFSVSSLMPKRAAHQIKKDAELVKEQVR